MQVHIDALQSLKIFQDMPRNHLNVIAKSMVARVYKPGQLIFLEGDPSVGLWFVLQGRVKIIKHSKSGRLQGLCLVNSGKCFGGCPLFDTDTNPANAQALDEVTLALLLREDLRRLLRTDPNVVTQLLKIYNRRISLLSRLGESLGSWSVPMRINDCLIAYANEHEEETVIHLTHDEIAALAGTAREVVTRHLGELEAEKIIETSPGQIIVHQIEKLSAHCITHQEAPHSSSV